ncbi:MAG: hypothetical protein A2096_05470 [Spirochaetes bacterium GWF1_41_5]|nr:MAG: hypothetical protein A2096_05470 [Spirochaetes bacterium GWF1_41_5]HBE01449.1 hypothetical protein [Spirochaetia bacterium]
MIADKKYFSRAHIEAQSGFSTPALCECAIYCLELLSEFSLLQIPFRFKGGNSLLLILDEPERFSIDIDISLSAERIQLEEAVQKLFHRSGCFTSFENRPPKTKPHLPMISFKLFYNSYYLPADQSFVMLDAILKPPAYGGYMTKIRVKNLYESECSVEVSDVSGLAADKLLAIGPAALGIPLGKNKEAQRLKHVFDISRLYDKKIDKKTLNSAIQSCLEQENLIQQTGVSMADVISDTKKFCSLPLPFPAMPEAEKADDPYLAEIITGFGDFKKHLFRTRYTWDLLKRDMSRVLSILEMID